MLDLRNFLDVLYVRRITTSAKDDGNLCFRIHIMRSYQSTRRVIYERS